MTVATEVNYSMKSLNFKVNMNFRLTKPASDGCTKAITARSVNFAMCIVVVVVVVVVVDLEMVHVGNKVCVILYTPKSFYA